MKNLKLSSALTWDELAEEYDKLTTGRKARTIPMHKVFDYCAARKDKFVVDEKEKTIHKIIKK